MEQRKIKAEKLVIEYEKILKDVIKVGNTFEPNRLTKVMQDAIALVTAKSPAFSTVAAATTAMYGFNHVIGQLRPRINDSVYSNDIIGLPFIGVVLSSSGSGKDSAYQAIMKTCDTAMNKIKQYIYEEELERAKLLAFKTLQADNISIQLDEITEDDCKQFMRRLPQTEGDDTSTKSGLIAELNKIASYSLSALSIQMTEFGTSLKSSGPAQEILQLLIVLYDMGKTSVSILKTEELKVDDIYDSYVSALLHSSPKSIFGDAKVRESINTLFASAMSRRAWLVYPGVAESYENNKIPETIQEARELNNMRRNTVAIKTTVLHDKITNVVDNMLTNTQKRVLSFSEEAGLLYQDFFEYNKVRAELYTSDSIKAIAINGLAFKTGRIAALFALLDETNVIEKNHMESAIYYAMYVEKYLDKMTVMLSAKSFTLLGDLFMEGETSITLDQAMSQGYVTKVTKDFKELLEPLNSYLRNNGVVTYSEEDKTFYYSAFKKLDESVGKDNSIVKTTDKYLVSYTKVDGVTKNGRKQFLNNFTNVKKGSFTLLKNVLTKDTIFSLFKYKDVTEKDGTFVKNKRNLNTITSSTKIVCIDVDKSDIPIKDMHEYLIEYKHIIATTSNKENKYRYRILLAVNIELDGDSTYSCIASKIAADLLISADKAGFNPAQPFYGYKNAEVYVNENGYLYDCTDFVSECKTHKDMIVTLQQNNTMTKAEQSKLKKAINTDPLKELDFAITAPNGMGQLSIFKLWNKLASMNDVMSFDEAKNIVNFVMTTWSSPLEQYRLKNLEKQFKTKFKF